jgi:hypothetical protein
MMVVDEAVSPALASSPVLSQTIVSKLVNHYLEASWLSKSVSRTPTTWLIVLGDLCGSGRSTFAAQLAQGFACSWTEEGGVHDAIATTTIDDCTALSVVDRETW